MVTEMPIAIIDQMDAYNFKIKTSDALPLGGFFFSSRRRHTRFDCDWSSDVCSSDLDRRPDCHLGPRERGALELERVAVLEVRDDDVVLAARPRIDHSSRAELERTVDA